MDEDIETYKHAAIEDGFVNPDGSQKDENQTTEEEDFTDNETMTKDQFDRKYNEAVVIIDKTGMGVVNFTDEEREKLEIAKSITLKEVESVELKTIKTKKAKKGKLETILKKHATAHSCRLVLPASGYTVTISGCSTYELIALMSDGQNALLETEAKWSLIHSKIIETSLGDMDFNTFLQNTAAVDYPVLLYGLICATYPDDDKIELQCQKDDCKKKFFHQYSCKSLIRAEKMSEKMKDTFMQTVDNSHTLDDAKKFHALSPVSQSKTIKLPISGIIIEVCIQSAYDFIYKSIKELSANKDPKYNQAAILASIVNKIYVPDPTDGEYFEFDGAMEIAQVIYTLGDRDNLILTKQGELLLNDLSFEFGFMNVICPYCKTVTLSLPMDLETILFYKYQQAMTTKID
jgi:hypothetical protein